MKQTQLSTEFSFLLLIIAFSSSCQKPQTSANHISADSLKSILKTEHGIILDVRTPEEFEEGHIAGSININYHDENFSAALDTLDKNKQYEVYCRSGNRSYKSIELMKKKGFKNIYHFEGGILNWEEKGFETVK